MHRVEDGELVDIHERLNATQRARIAGLCSIRDHARALLDLQLADADDGRQRHERAMLNGSYDRYVARFGCPSNRVNSTSAAAESLAAGLIARLSSSVNSSGRSLACLRKTASGTFERYRLQEALNEVKPSVKNDGRYDPRQFEKVM